MIPSTDSLRGYVELPYTLPQDHTLFIFLKESTTDIWKKKLDWIVEKGGLALFISHPDYMAMKGARTGAKEYSMNRYIEFLEYVTTAYKGQYWHALPKDLARFWMERSALKIIAASSATNKAE